MSKVIVLYRENDEVSIIYPAPKSRRPEELENDWLLRILEKANTENLDYEIINKSDLPADRKDRNKWNKKKNKPFTIKRDL